MKESTKLFYGWLAVVIGASMTAYGVVKLIIQFTL